MKNKTMTKECAYREFHISQEAFHAKDERITMIRDSWEGGYTVQFTHFACNVVSMVVSGEVVSYSGRWM